MSSYIEHREHCDNTPKKEAPSWFLQWWNRIYIWLNEKFTSVDEHSDLNKEVIIDSVEGSKDAVIDSVEGSKDAVIDAVNNKYVPSVSENQAGLAKETNATANKQAILTEVAKQATSAGLNAAKSEIIAAMPTITEDVAKEAKATDNKNEILDNLGDKATTAQLAAMQQSINERFDRIDYRDKGGVYTSRVIDGGDARSTYGGARIFLGGASDSTYQTSSSTNIDCGDAENFSEARTLTSEETTTLQTVLAGDTYATILNKILIAQAG